MITGQAREEILKCIGEAEFLYAQLMDAAMEARAISSAMSAALALPPEVAADKTANMPERFAALLQRIEELSK